MRVDFEIHDGATGEQRMVSFYVLMDSCWRHSKTRYGTRTFLLAAISLYEFVPRKTRKEMFMKILSDVQVCLPGMNKELSDPE